MDKALDFVVRSLNVYSYALSLARVAELVDALASGASDRKIVGVQVPPRARFFGVSPLGGAPSFLYPHAVTLFRLGLVAGRIIWLQSSSILRLECSQKGLKLWRASRFMGVLGLFGYSPKIGLYPKAF